MNYTYKNQRNKQDKEKEKKMKKENVSSKNYQLLKNIRRDLKKKDNKRKEEWKMSLRQN